MIRKGQAKMLPPSVLRAGRALTGLSQAEIAARAGVSVPTVKRAEADEGLRVAPETVGRIKAVIEAAGVEFIGERDDRAGVRFRPLGE